MDERFVSLAAYLRGIANGPAPTASPPAVAVTSGALDCVHPDVVHELTLMRLAATEAYERAAERLLRSLAIDVLGRELALAPPDLDALAKRALATFGDRDPIALSISPADADRVQSRLPVRLDPALGVGDLVVVVRDGTFESHFAFRLEEALGRAVTCG